LIVSNSIPRTESEIEGRQEGSESQILEPPASQDHQYQSRADLRFSIAVAIALALPVFIALSVYLMAALVLVAEG
jgi:hypothetical protein